MKRRPSYRSLLLIVGIFVALVIAFSSWMYAERTSAAHQRKDNKKTSLHAQSIIQKLIHRSEARFHTL